MAREITLYYDQEVGTCPPDEWFAAHPTFDPNHTSLKRSVSIRYAEHIYKAVDTIILNFCEIRHVVITSEDVAIAKGVVELLMEKVATHSRVESGEVRVMMKEL